MNFGSLAELLQVRPRGYKSFKKAKGEQQEKLQKIVKYAYQHSKFYKDLYDNNSIDINSFDIKQLPTVTKSDILNNYNQLTTQDDITVEEINGYVSNESTNNFKGRYSIFSSGGSSGIRCHIPYDMKGMYTLNALTMLRSGLFMPRFSQRIAFMGGVNHSKNTSNLGRNGIIKNQVQIKVIPLYYTEQEVIDELNQFQPTTIASYSYMLRNLSIAKLDGRLKISPIRLRCGGTPFQEKDKELVKRAFGILPIENYGASEALMIASGCTSYTGMHINEDCYYVEFVRDDMTSVSEGEISDGILVTNLYNYTFPLIRYRLDDRLKYTTEKCSCGSEFPRILSVSGRNTDYFIFKSLSGNEDKEIHPIDLANRILDICTIKEFRIVQNEKNALRIHIVCNNTDMANKAFGEISKRLKDFFDRMPEKLDYKIAAYYYEELARDAVSGKLVPFITLEKWKKFGNLLESKGIKLG